MRVTNRMQMLVTRHDLLIDPGLVTSRARPNHFRECAINSNFKRFSRPSTPGRMREMKCLQWTHAAPFRPKPFNRVVCHLQRDDAEPITLPTNPPRQNADRHQLKT